MQAIRGALSARTRPVALLPALVAALALTWAQSAAAHTAYGAASAHPSPIPWTGWNGRPIERPHKPVDEALLSKAAFPAGWSAGAVRYGTGYHRLGGSERVREVQRRLTSLGYHTGPVDGLYGPLTRSAVQWFQIKHGLRPTGVVAATTLAALREPNGFMQQIAAQAKHPAAPSGQAPAPAATKRPQPQPAARAHGGTPDWPVPAVIAALIVALALLLGVVRPAVRRAGARRARPAAPPPSAPLRAAVMGPDGSAPAPPAALGYVPGGQEGRSEENEEAIAEACRQRGWTLVRLVREVQGADARSARRPGLRYALDQLDQGTASRLVVHRLEHIARSLADLRAVLSWFMRAGVALTVLDVGLDTGTAEGRTAMRTLLAVCRSERGREAARTRAGLVSERVAGRPAVEDSPELAGRIRAMRARGMTLQAIADTLNREEVPTVRGGAEWRPSSVQAVLGYRRTRTQKP